MPFQSTFVRRLSILILAAAYIAALTPFTTYITDDTPILNMVIVVGLASIAMTIAGAYAAFQALGRDKHKFAIPARLLHSNTLSQWWIAFRYTRRYQWWLVLPRLGLAYGLVQWLHVYGQIGSWRWEDFNPYYYISHSGSRPPYTLVYPQLETLLFAGVFIVLFTIAEAGLNASIILLVRNIMKSRYWDTVILCGLRFGLALIILPITLLASPLLRFTDWYNPPCYENYNCTQQDYADNRWWDHQQRRVWETFVTSVDTGFGRGVLLSANIMRPIGEGTLFAGNCTGYCSPTAWDNRPFVLRQVVAGLLGLLMYGGLTGGVLWLSSKRAAPP